MDRIRYLSIPKSASTLEWLQAHSESSHHDVDRWIINPSEIDEIDGLLLKRFFRTASVSLVGFTTIAVSETHHSRIIDPNASIRRHAQNLGDSIIDFAGGFGVPTNVSPLISSPSCRLSRDESLRYLSAALEQWAPRAAALEAPLHWNPWHPSACSVFESFREVSEFLAQLRTKNVRLHLHGTQCLSPRLGNANHDLIRLIDTIELEPDSMIAEAQLQRLQMLGFPAAVCFLPVSMRDFERPSSIVDG